MQPVNSALSSRFIPGWLVLLGALTGIAPFAVDMYLPGFPSIQRSLGAPPGSMELTLASFFIGMALGQLFYGPVSDRFGRKKPLYVGLSVFVLASIACVYTDDIAQFIAWRFLQALGGCAGLVIARAVIRDRCNVQEAGRAFSLLMLVFGVAPILAPMAGSWVLAAFGWHAIFVFLALFGVGCMIALHFALTETHDPATAQPLRLGRTLVEYGRLCRHRAFMGYTMSSGLVIAGMFAYIAGSPFVLIDLYGLEPDQYSWVFGTNACGMIVGSQINAYLLRSVSLVSLFRAQLWAPLVIGTVLLGLFMAGPLPLPALLIGLFLFVASAGFIMPNSGAAALGTQSRSIAGTASALMGALQFGLATASSALVGAWHDGTALPLAAVMCMCGVGAWLIDRAVTGKNVTMSNE
jgi:DHA1 family bicyclomycin/chloramphenicol resistance-like MFS transporter